MKPAAAAYAARVDAVRDQHSRTRKGEPEGDRWQAVIDRFRMDPLRPMDANLAVLAEYVEPDDVVVDVGGGAGRVSLPLALRCREVIDVDPSPSMTEAFLASASEAGITNARVERTDWLDAGAVGDLTVVCSVTYFIREIVSFIERLQSRSRRRVLITVWSDPPPMRDAALFRLLRGEEQERVPGHEALLAVLWEMGILPDLRVLPGRFTRADAVLQTKQESISWAIAQVGVQDEQARDQLDARFDELFARTEAGYRPLWRPDPRELLITWPTSG